MRSKKLATEKQAARRFGEFARPVRRNLRQAQRIRERAEHATRLCYEKAGVAILDAKASSGMSEEAFAAWLAPFGLSQDRLLQCLELGQVALDRRKAGAAEREVLQKFRFPLGLSGDQKRRTVMRIGGWAGRLLAKVIREPARGR